MTKPADSLEGHGPPPTEALPLDSGRTLQDTPRHSGSTVTGPAPPPPEPAPCEFPKAFGRFRLTRRIARGGMGEVFEAEELTAEGGEVVRRVALKRILPRYLQSEAAVERFRRETQAGKALDHPNIVPVYESGDVNGEHYFTMPYVAGGDLSRHVDGPRLTPRQAARVVMQMALAVEYAHRGPGKAVIHRDIKPQNIVLQPAAAAGEADLGDDSRLSFIPRLTDFGLARLVTEESSLSLSQKGEVMGTPGFMPPEQALGEVDAIGPASDVYGLGAVLYALLAGHPPFPKPAGRAVPVLVILDQVRNQEPDRPGLRAPAVPPELEDVCLKCLRKERADRYASAGQLAEALDDFLEGRPRIRHTPRRAGWLGRAWARLLQSMRKHPVRTGYIVTSAVALILLAVTVWRIPVWQAQQTRRQAEAFAAAALAEEGRDRGQAIRLYFRAVERYEGVIGDAPPDAGSLPLHLARAEARIRRAALLKDEPKDRKEAEEDLRLAEQELDALSAAAPDNASRRTLLADACQMMAEVISAPDTPAAHEKALPAYRKALALREALLAAEEGDPARLQALARCHGYMGDSFLMLGDGARCRQAYERAKAAREAVLALVPPGDVKGRVVAQCLHARDYWNFGAHAERFGTLDEARRCAIQRVAYYDDEMRNVSSLPGEFRAEKADALTWAANMELNSLPEGAARPSFASPLKRLERALEEVRALEKSVPQPRFDVDAARAWALLVRGKALLLLGEDGRKDLEDARSFYQDPETPGYPVLRYRLALTLTLLARDAGDERQAVEALERAISAGFKNFPRLRQEKGFARMRDRPAFLTAMKRIEEPGR